MNPLLKNIFELLWLQFGSRCNRIATNSSDVAQRAMNRRVARQRAKLLIYKRKLGKSDL